MIFHFWIIDAWTSWTVWTLDSIFLVKMERDEMEVIWDNNEGLANGSYGIIACWNCAFGIIFFLMKPAEFRNEKCGLKINVVISELSLLRFLDESRTDGCKCLEGVKNKIQISNRQSFDFYQSLTKNFFFFSLFLCLSLVCSLTRWTSMCGRWRWVLALVTMCLRMHLCARTHDGDHLDDTLCTCGLLNKNKPQTNKQENTVCANMLKQPVLFQSASSACFHRVVMNRICCYCLLTCVYCWWCFY